MFDRRKHQTTTEPHVVKGAGLARGPALVLGTILAVAGLILFLHSGDTPRGGFPDADATGTKLLGFESNGWTAFFTTTAGVILLFAAAQHLLAKLLGLAVGIALAACVVLDLVDGPGVLGLAAANWAVDLGWGIAAVLLLLNVFAPRIKHEEPVGHRGLHDDTAAVGTRPARTTTGTHVGDRGTHVGDHDTHADHRTHLPGTGTTDGDRTGTIGRRDDGVPGDTPGSVGSTRIDR